MPWISSGLLLAALCLTDQKPACSKHNHGRFWPEAANTNAEVRRSAARDGSLELCSVAIWKYKWQPVTVSVRRLVKDAKLTPAQFTDTANNPPK